MRAGTARMNDGDVASGRPPFALMLLRFVLRRPQDSLAGAVAALAAIVILVNALFMQTGPHPAPIFANKPPAEAAPIFGPATSMLRSRPADGRIDVPATARPRALVVADIQRELARRGFYDGSADGVYGPKTDAAIRNFEQAATLRPSAEPNEALLAAIARSSIKARPAPAAPYNDPIAALLAPSVRTIAVQRALSDFGYGPLKPTGVLDAETKTAIERFERARKRPVTGRISDQLVHDLAALTGRPLE